ncbi:MAG TPA: AAA family ATPase, partial [Acidimicrobiales bacterium]|nr:AAA family ATPase [Acidimicrobiales bacterium]
VAQRSAAALALGRHAPVVGERQALAGEHPLRAGLPAALALALYRSGRQADALRALADASTRLREELGLEPSRQLRDLEVAILAHDRSLDGLARPTSHPHVGASATSDAGNPLVGRDLELDDLLAAYKEAAEDARFVVLEGDPGIGKTRLADELATSASGLGSLAVWGRSDESGAAPALWPWLPVLREAAARLDDVPEALTQVLAGAAPLVSGQGGAVQFERFDAIATVLEQVGCAGPPLVVLLDDLQWADTASLELVQLLATRLRCGVLVVVTVRTPERGSVSPLTDALGAIARRQGSRRLRLRGLSAHATSELLGAVAPAITDAHVARIHERAEGNPFYAIELARLLAEDDGVGGAVPASVRDAVRRRLASLPDPSVEALTVAAIAGREVDVGLVARAVGCDLGPCLDHLDVAATHRLLVESPSVPGALRFAHALVREVLLDDLTPVRRARFHLAVADALAGPGGDASVGRDEVEVLAEHLWRAVSLGVGERAASALERAAETAISRVAYTAAEDLLTRAAQLRRSAPASHDAQQAELATLLRLLEVMQATRYFSGTDRAVLARAMELAVALGLGGVTRKLAWSEWAALSTASRVGEAQRLAERYFLQWGADPRPHVASAAHAMVGVDEWSRGRFSTAVEHLDRAASLLEGLPPPDDAFEQEHRLVAHAFGLFSHAAHGDMTPEEALAGFDFLLAVLPPVAVPAVCGFAGAVASVHARWDDLDRFTRHALDLDPAAQFAFFGGQLLMFQGLVSASRGQADEGIASFTEGRARYRAVGGRSGTATYQALLAELLARGERVADAAELVAGARRLTDETGEGWNEVTVCIAEAVVAHSTGDGARAGERLRAAFAAAQEQGAHGLGRRAEAVAAELGRASAPRS